METAWVWRHSRAATDSIGAGDAADARGRQLAGRPQRQAGLVTADRAGSVPGRCTSVTVHGVREAPVGWCQWSLLYMVIG